MTKIIVDCEENDIVDIRCGGPAILGFDFFVEDDIVDEAIKKIKKLLKENECPLMGITTVKISEDDKTNYKVWSLEDIRKCIEEGY